MSSALKDTFNEIQRRVKRKLRHENLSAHRMFVLVSSTRGRKRIGNFVVKSSRFLLHRLFGIKTDIHADYRKWAKKNLPDAETLDKYRKECSGFTYRPKISVLLPVYNTPEKFLKQSIESVQEQVYSEWELCISDDCSTEARIRPLLEQFAASDKRIRVVFREHNGHISENSNSALALATGTFIALLDHDDLLTPDALFHNVRLLNEDPVFDFIYSDEDKIDESGRLTEPHFKPDWCPENLLTRNYVCHLAVMRKSLVDAAGGFRKGYEGSQDYDLFLRVTEIAKKIGHIPNILYHWRVHPESTSKAGGAKPYAYEAGRKAIEDALVRRGLEGTVVREASMTGFYGVRFNLKNKGKVSVIIPSKNRQEMCESLLSSLTELTDYPDYEIILVNNNSDEPGFFEMTARWAEKLGGRFRCIDEHGPFNFSRLMNAGTAASSGTYLLLLNNDTQVTHADWMTAMAEYAQLKHIGAVGARLLFPDDTIQHAGVVIGIGGLAEHVFTGADKDENGYFNYLKCVNNFMSVTAACLMIQKEKYAAVGGFDEGLPVEYNDVDFCLKLTEHGFRNVYLPHVTLYHHESISRGHPHKTRESYQQHLRDVALYTSRWQKYIYNDPCYNPHLSRVYSDFRLRIHDQ